MSCCWFDYGIPSSHTSGATSVCQVFRKGQLLLPDPWSSLFNKPCTQIFSTKQGPSPPCTCPRRNAIVHSYFAGKARTLQVNPFEQPFRLSYLYIQSAHSSLSAHLAHWVIVVCLFFTSSCEFLEGGDHLLTWFFHLINNHLYRPMALCITQHSHAEDPFQLLSM